MPESLLCGSWVGLGKVAAVRSQTGSADLEALHPPRQPMVFWTRLQPDRWWATKRPELAGVGDERFGESQSKQESVADAPRITSYEDSLAGEFIRVVSHAERTRGILAQ